MNWYYITGFFDADGCITVVSNNKGKNKTLQVSFSNNELEILKSIKDFIDKELECNGSISKKLAKKSTHSDAYELKYSYRNALRVARRLSSFHPKKKHRIEIYEKIQVATKRNGKYTKEEQNLRDLLILDFFKHEG